MPRSAAKDELAAPELGHGIIDHQLNALEFLDPDLDLNRITEGSRRLVFAFDPDNRRDDAVLLELRVAEADLLLYGEYHAVQLAGAEAGPVLFGVLFTHCLADLFFQLDQFPIPSHNTDISWEIISVLAPFSDASI